MLRMRFGASALALATVSCAVSSAAWATSTTVDNTTRTTSLNMSGSDTLSITATGVFHTSGKAVVVNGASTSALTISNLGTLMSDTDRAIRINDNNTNAHSMTVINGSTTNSTALIQSNGDDAIQSSNALNGGTIDIENYGTILSTANRAINLTAATGGTVTINNYASGLIEAVGTKDVIRPASGSTIYNYGKIESTDEGTAGTDISNGITEVITEANRNDAIDFQSNATDTVSGSVYNYGGGIIQGAKHGITGNIGTAAGYYIYNAADGQITGLNGSGINLDIPDDMVGNTAAIATLKTTTVVNYGTITGEAHDTSGSYFDTDGDGVDVDALVHIDNYGTIQALGALGYKDGVLTDPNISDGLAIGGGTVNNYADGVIYSVGRGIQVDDSNAGPAFAATNIFNAGRIQGGTLAINIVGDLADTLVNKGTIIGNVFMGGGNDTVSLYTGQTMDGTFDGGDGAGDTLKLERDSGGALTGSISNITNFELLDVDGGTWSLGDDQSYSGGTTVANSATLIAGTTLTSAVAVNLGGKLTGTGTVSSIDAFGTIAAGNAPGTTLSTTGDVTFESGSTFAVTTNATEATQLAVGGKATLGGSVVVTSNPGAYTSATTYTILTSHDDLGGTFTGADDDLAFLDASLSYDTKDVYLTLTRNDTALWDVAETPNQNAVAHAIGNGIIPSTLYDQIVAESADDARADYDSLSGETYASNAGTLADQAALIADTILSRFGTAGGQGEGGAPLSYGDDTRPLGNAAGKALADAPVYSAWAKGFGQTLTENSDGNAAALKGNLGGGLVGMDMDSSGVRAGFAAGFAAASSDVTDRSSSSDMRTGILAAYAGTETGTIRFHGGASYGWSSIDTERTATAGQITEHPTASYDAGVANAFIEASQSYRLAGYGFEPFAGLAYANVAQGAFTEQNAPVTGLSSAAQSFDTLYSTLGVRVASSFSVGDTLWHDHAMVGWRHAYGDLSPERTLLFQETGASFLVDGTPIAANSAVIEAGIDAMLSRSATVGVAYSGALSNSGSSHAIKVSGGLQF